MKYETYENGIKLSKLGLGAMRLPQTEPGFAKPIDQAKADELIDYCMAHGVNYYDTAYIYHGGKSEAVLGQALSRYPRTGFHVADKVNIQANPDYAAQLQEQLKRLQMEYIDFYLRHGVTDLTALSYEKSGCIPHFQEQKRLGKIKYLGFSFHGTPECLRRILEQNSWDFVQIQLNYYDWFQGTAKEQYEILRENHIPIMVMEPVHGGMLADLPGIAVVLSGMSNMEQTVENVNTASCAYHMSEEELRQLEKISALLRRRIAVPCTSCRYCCENCPQGLDIPALLTAYNDYRDEAASTGDKNMASWRLGRLKALDEEKQPGACIGCGSCTEHCPQGLDIPGYMKEMAGLLG